MPTVPLWKTKNHFVSSAGFVFKIENGKEVICKAHRTPNSKDIQVFIDNKAYSLLYVMIEHFIGDIKTTDKIRYTVDKDLRIPEGSIRIKSAIGISNILTPEQEAKMHNYKCIQKANGANSRSEQKISGVEVYNVLCASDFQCVYCNTNLTPNNWHLDHYQSLSRGGKNIFQNLVASCFICNVMKGAMDGLQFHKQCKKVAEKFRFKMQNSEEQKEVSNG